MAAIRYKIEDIIFLFMKKPPDKINYNTQKEKLPYLSYLIIRTQLYIVKNQSQDDYASPLFSFFLLL